ncbi:Arc family DNA-binding protein [Moraxella ovis]|uniref:Arc family DNA-binding protein n=1 Tax=Moraxella ovis TaxID=29433 RepID=UPI000D8CE5FC|nr:Arc family DNA-binding protein [Moraxella ovis]SPX85342.1 Arc-like DNA binding domain [Moraxella ovis]STZ06355.1 Arc-like DNA binding domain [Moraxella ovis]
MGQHLNADFKIRLPHELKDKVKISAKQHNRTMTADIVARLEQTFNCEQGNEQRPVINQNSISYLDTTELLQNQDTWKRSQVRLPNSLYQVVAKYAEDKSMSLNTAIIHLLDIGLVKETERMQSIRELRQALNEANAKMQALENQSGQ